MQRRRRAISFSNRWALAVASIGTAAALYGCGGDVAAIVGFIGSAGGDWKQGRETQASPRRVEIVRSCAVDGCKINISPAGRANFFSDSFDVNYTGNIGACPPNAAQGRVAGRRIDLPNCFRGSYVTINEAVSDDGTLRMFFNFGAGRLQVECGLWVDFDAPQRRFKFDAGTSNGDSTTVPGNEQSTPPTPVSLVIRDSNIEDPAGPFETTITSFTMGTGAPWSGRFVGVSGMELRRGSEVLRLERQPDSAGTACP